MAGPIRTFIDRLQENQPLRNGVRGFLGLPQRRGSNIIDPMEEMSSREREQGVDVSDPYPSSQPFQMASMKQPVRDESQPYAGMGMVQSMVTSKSDAKRPNVQQASQATSTTGKPLSSFGAQVKAINDTEGLTPAQRAYQIGSLAYSQAAAAQTNEERMTYAQIGKDFFAMHGHQNAVDAGLKASSDATTQVVEAIERQKQLQELVNQGQLNAINAQGQQAPAATAAVQKAEQDASSPARRQQLLMETLTQNPGMSPAAFAEQQVYDAVQFALASKAAPPDDTAKAAIRYAAFQSAAGQRIGELTAAAAKQAEEQGGGAADFFSEYHPRHTELSAPFRQRVAKDPAQYDQVRQDVIQSISGPIHSTLRMKGYPNEFIIQYINDTADGMVGPRPEKTSWQGFTEGVGNFFSN